MASELTAVTATGLTVYANILNASARRWNGSAFEAYVGANYATYDIAMTEQGSSGVFVADFPTAITTAGAYQIIYYRQAGGTPAQGDPVVGTGSVVWNGTLAVSGAVAGAMSGSDLRNYIVRTFKRTDKDTEIYEAITDTIKDMKRRFGWDEAMVEKDTTDTISVLGDYKLDDEDDLGLMVGDVICQDGTQSYPLDKLTKDEFDRFYPNPTAYPRGRPRHWCRFGGQILIGPVPDSTSYQYHISFSAETADITAATTSVPFSGADREILKHGALARLYTDLENEAQAVKYGALYEAGVVEAKRKDRVNAGAVVMTRYRGI